MSFDNDRISISLLLTISYISADIANLADLVDEELLESYSLMPVHEFARGVALPILDVSRTFYILDN